MQLLPACACRTPTTVTREHRPVEHIPIREPA
jgi:hypothetical protein